MRGVSRSTGEPSARMLFELSDAITHGEADLRSSISLNEQLMLEHLAVRWTRLAEPE